MKNPIALLILLAILLPSFAIGADISQWKHVDRTMADLVESGFQIVSHTYAYSPNKSDRRVEIYILQKNQWAYRCAEVLNWTMKTENINCKKLVPPFKK